MRKGILLFAILLSIVIIPLGSKTVAAAVPTPCKPSLTAGVDTEIGTELGNLCTDPNSLIQRIIQILLGIAGGVSLLLLIAGAGSYLLSGGNPESVEGAKTTITHALAGFLLIILSVFLVRLIGIDVLALPGLSKSGPGGILTP